MTAITAQADVRSSGNPLAASALAMASLQPPRSRTWPGIRPAMSRGSSGGGGDGCDASGRAAGRADRGATAGGQQQGRQDREDQEDPRLETDEHDDRS